MITIKIARNGINEGLSMLAESPQKFNTWNPYNTFFDPKEETIDKLKTLWHLARLEDGSMERSESFYVPQHLILVMAMMIEGQTLISYPESGVLPGVQSLFFIFVVLLHKETNKNYIINTLSEYMVRQSQLLVLKEILSTDDITIYDFPNEGENISGEKINETLFGMHDYENEIGLFKLK